MQSLFARLQEPRVAWAVLGFAMLCSTALIVHVTRGQSFAIDELFYFGRVADNAGELVHYAPFSPEYLLAPFNDHLPLGGRFVYELVFATFGAEYTVFVLVNIAALLACIALTFELARRRVGAAAALAPCIVLLFLGFATEQLLWPLDFNTAGSLAAGLGAVLALEREDRRGDLLACLLLALSVAMIELGLCFAVGVAAWLVLHYRRQAISRSWIVLVPVVLYALWWIWARKFDQSEASAGNLGLVPETLLEGAASALGALTGTSPAMPGSYDAPVTWFGKALAVAAAVTLLVRLRLGSLPHTIWVWLISLGSYWALLALAGRAAMGGRYVLVGAVLVTLLAADAIGKRVSDGVAAALLVLALIALPANIAHLTGGRENDVLRTDPPVSSTEYAMLELARDHVDPAYVPSNDPRVDEAGGGLFIGIPAEAYLDAAAHNGSLAYSLERIRSESEKLRLVADATLVGALGIEAEAAPPPADTTGCRTLAIPVGASEATVEVGPGDLLLRPLSDDRAALWLARFAGQPRSVGVEYLPSGRWTRVVIPGDSAPDPWRLAVDGPTLIC